MADSLLVEEHASLALLVSVIGVAAAVVGAVAGLAALALPEVDVIGSDTSASLRCPERSQLSRGNSRRNRRLALAGAAR